VEIEAMKRLSAAAVISLFLAAPTIASAHVWVQYDYSNLVCVAADMTPDAFIQYEQNETGETVTVDRNPETSGAGALKHVAVSWQDTDPGAPPGAMHVDDFFTSYTACDVFKHAQQATDQNTDLN
jgi:hypothetical protein